MANTAFYIIGLGQSLKVYFQMFAKKYLKHLKVGVCSRAFSEDKVI